MSETYLTIKQAATLLQCSPMSIRRRIREGKIKTYNPAGKVLILKEELAAFVASTVRQ